jgi:hypothetical protein
LPIWPIWSPNRLANPPLRWNRLANCPRSDYPGILEIGALRWIPKVWNRGAMIWLPGTSAGARSAVEVPCTWRDCCRTVPGCRLTGPDDDRCKNCPALNRSTGRHRSSGKTLTGRCS